MNHETIFDRFFEILRIMPKWQYFFTKWTFAWNDIKNGLFYLGKIGFQTIKISILKTVKK